MSLWFLVAVVPISHWARVLLISNGTSAATLWWECLVEVVSALGHGCRHWLLLLLPVNHESLIFVICWRPCRTTKLSELWLRGWRLRCFQFISGSVEVLGAIKVLLRAHHDSWWLLGDDWWVNFVGCVLNNIIKFLLCYPEFSQCTRLYRSQRLS